MKTVKKHSAVPIYGSAAVWALWCLFLPLYKPSHFLLLALAGGGSFAVLKKLFPDKDIKIEEPFTTGDADTDKLLKDGEMAVSEMRRLAGTIPNTDVCAKVGTLADVTERIFRDIIEDPDDIPQVRRFAGYYLPTTMKLLHAYDRMSAEEHGGENVASTLSRIEDILDTTIAAYKKQLDALFANQALDIETDITVLESMLKREGLTGKDF